MDAAHDTVAEAHTSPAYATGEPTSKNRITRDIGVRVRIYPTLKQAERLDRMMATRHGVWNLVCDGFERERERVRKADECAGRRLGRTSISGSAAKHSARSRRGVR